MEALGGFLLYLLQMAGLALAAVIVFAMFVALGWWALFWVPAVALLVALTLARILRGANLG